MNNQALWTRFKSYYFYERRLNFGFDLSRMNFSQEFFSNIEPKMSEAYDAMDSLVGGAIANPDEKRQVGHYWLRNSSKAPNVEIKSQIENTLANIKSFSSQIHQGKIAPEKADKFVHILVVGIGGSALGPQFVNNALCSPADAMDAYFFDNTDPDGMEKVLRRIPDLSKTLCLIVSKSGGTKETRNGQLVAKAAYAALGLNFSKHFVAVTGEGSELDNTAKEEKWLARFPMWDWVGGRTSEFSAVGLLPAALQGFDIDAMLKGAQEMDELTARRDTHKNPAALLALMWYYVGDGRGLKDMVVLPYNDRIELFSRYLQQLVMESLGKERDLDDRVVNQGLAVYGNKGSTDQHAYVQQLRDGLNNFFAVFIEVLSDRSSVATKATVMQASRSKSGTLPESFKVNAIEVEPSTTCGDYLSGFLLGTRKALYESMRESITVTVPDVSEHSIGMLVALFERAVGYYATLVNINAYHQPGVEAGKKAAGQVLAIQKKITDFLKTNLGTALSAEEIAQKISESDSAETVFKILRHMAANGRVKCSAGEHVFADRYSL